MHPAWLVSEQDGNPYNRKTKEILDEFIKTNVPVSSGNVIYPSGNALKYLGEYFDANKEYVNPYRENPKDVQTISFSPDGTVLNGNVNETCIMDILNSYELM